MNNQHQPGKLGGRAGTGAKYTLDDTTATLKEWAAMTGIQEDTLRSRIRAGWTIQDALKRKPRTYIKRSKKTDPPFERGSASTVTACRHTRDN